MILLTLALLAPPGATLDDDWSGVWRRLHDRQGRPDPEGAQLQWAGDPQYLEYPFDQETAGFPLASTDAWRRADSGARLYVQSITEFTLTNAVQVKTRWPAGGGWHVGVRYDQLQDRQTQSHLARLVVTGDDLGGTPLFVEGHLFPRWTKLDADLEAAVGARDTDLGEARLRLFAFDPFVDAAFALAESRGAELERTQDQRDPPLAVAVELLSARWRGVRAELYGGRVFEAATSTRITATDEQFVHTRAGWLGGALAEWSGGWFTGGLTVLAVQADDRWRGSIARRVDEGYTRNTLYAIAGLPAAVRLEAEARASRRTIEDDADGKDFTIDRWLWSLRAFWEPGENVGAEVRLLRADRRTEGNVPAFLVGDTAHRLVTRCTLRFGPHVWMAIGTGWDLDGDSGVYDGSGLTLILLD